MLRLAPLPLFLGLLCLPASSQTLFTNSRQLSTGTRPSGKGVADINGDGHLDIVVANEFSGTLGVFLGAGDGTFTALPDTLLPGDPRDLALGDVDNDGHLDLLIADIGMGSLEIMLGDGTGTFQPDSSVSLGGFPSLVRVGHLNQDAWLDVALGNQSDDVLLFLGQGGGSFGPPTLVNVGSSVRELALGDLEGDGDTDIVVATNGSFDRVRTYLGDGTGQFTLGGGSFSSQPRGLQLADLDLDGDLDIITGNRTVTANNLVQTYLVSANGNVGPATSYFLPVSASEVTALDMNADGLPDVVVSLPSDQTLRTYVGTGGGNLALTIDSPTDTAPYGLANGDFNSDGRADVVAIEELANSLTIHFSDGVGSFVGYCTPGPNSMGCVPSLVASGTPSISDLAPFQIRALGLRNFQTTMFIYRVGGSQADIPFMGGTLCIGPTEIRRTPPGNSGGDLDLGECTGTAFLDFNDFALGQAGGHPDPQLLILGNTYRIQLWMRDTGSATGVSLTSALEVTPWL